MKKKVLLSILLVCVAIFSVFSLTACGDSKLKTAVTSFKEIDEIYQESETFNDDFSINFGTVVQNKINSKEDGYVQLQDLYNKIFKISQSYIDNNKEYIINRTEEQLSKSSKNAIKSLNSELGSYKKKLKNFIEARNNFVSYFQDSSSKFDSEEVDQNHLSDFRGEFGKFVESNLNLAMSLANAVESTEIFERVNSGTPTELDSKVVKEYVGIKLLPIFSKFKLTELENKFNFENTQQVGEDKERIRVLINAVDREFQSYQNYFKNGKDPEKISLEMMNSLWEDRIQPFLEETDNFYKALKGFNLFNFAKDGYVLKNYKKSNGYAEEYLLKMEQFVKVSLPDFMTQVENILK